MNKITISLLVITLSITVFSMGCTLRSPEESPTYSVLPEVILDYDFDTDAVKIWVKSAITDFRYDNISIEMISKNQSLVTEDNNTYCLYSQIKSENFNVSVSVLSKEKIFQYIANVDVTIEEYVLLITITDQETQIPELFYQEDLPYKKVLRELEV